MPRDITRPSDHDYLQLPTGGKIPRELIAAIEVFPLSTRVPSFLVTVFRHDGKDIGSLWTLAHITRQQAAGFVFLDARSAQAGPAAP